MYLVFTIEATYLLSHEERCRHVSSQKCRREYITARALRDVVGSQGSLG